MFLRLAVCSALLAAASVASAQVRPPVGTVYFKDATDCFTMNDENGFPMCVMASNGGSYSASTAYRTVTSMKLPYGRYVLTGKVLNYLGGARPFNPWVVVECQLEDQNHVVIDYSSDNYGSHAQMTGYVNGYVYTAQNGGTPLVLSGVLDVKSMAGATVSITCRVQGQGIVLNADGTASWGPIQNIRFHNAQIMAVSAAAINLVK
jgi:hypothetical protein